jgi:ketosteroid isomerase-like protein
MKDGRQWMVAFVSRRAFDTDIDETAKRQSKVAFLTGMDTRLDSSISSMRDSWGIIMSADDELATFYEEFARALESRDPDRLSQFYTDDADFLSNGTAPVIGREQIGHLFQGPTATKKTTFEVGAVLEDGDLVVDVGNILHDGVRVARFVGVYRRQVDGSLKMAVDVPMKDLSVI